VTVPSEGRRTHGRADHRMDLRAQSARPSRVAVPATPDTPSTKPTGKPLQPAFRTLTTKHPTARHSRSRGVDGRSIGQALTNESLPLARAPHDPRQHPHPRRRGTPARAG
jgi:hypothetical protein